VNFHDSRIPRERDPQTSQIDSDSGGSIEVFSADPDAKARNDVLVMVKLNTEFDLLVGRVLVRLSGRLTADRVADYKKARTGQSTGSRKEMPGLFTPGSDFQDGNLSASVRCRTQCHGRCHSWFVSAGVVQCRLEQTPWSSPALRPLSGVA
jgi:hypothetical protein